MVPVELAAYRGSSEITCSDNLPPPDYDTEYLPQTPEQAKNTADELGYVLKPQRGHSPLPSRR